METRRNIILLLLFCFFIFSNQTDPTKDESFQNLYVIVGKLINVRSGPGRTHAVVGKVRNGQVVNYLGTEGLWTKIGEMAYVPSVYALPKNRVKFGAKNVAETKPLNEINTLVNPVYQTTITSKTITNDDGTETTQTQSTTTHLETPVASIANTNTGVNANGSTLPIVSDSTITKRANKSNPNQVSTTTAVQTLEHNVNKKANAILSNSLNTQTDSSSVVGYSKNDFSDSAISTKTDAGNTLLNVMQSQPVAEAELKTYKAKHIKAKTVVDTLNNIDAIYDAEAKTDTEFTADEFVKRYYKGLTKTDVVFNTDGKPINNFALTLSPKVGDIATSGTHQAIVKQVTGDVVALIEQNYKWHDKKKTGFYAPKNRKLTLKNGIGIDAKGTRYVFYAAK